jgi:hypothetical protein
MMTMITMMMPMEMYMDLLPFSATGVAVKGALLTVSKASAGA